MTFRKISIRILVLLLLVVAAYAINLAIPRHDYFIERVGLIADAEVIPEQRERHRGYTVRLTSTTGLAVDMRVLVPDVDVSEKLPLVLVLGGHETGKDAVDLVGDPQGIAFAAIDYPYHGGTDLDNFWKSIAAIPHVQNAFLDAPPAASLALHWIRNQPWVDADRTELAGVSLGVPFAAVAGAVDERFSRVWLMHGGGDNAAWVAHNAKRHIENDVMRNVMTHLTLFAVYGNSFDTRKWIPEIATRPTVLVAARDDDFVPPEAQAPLIKAAQSPYVELIWTDGLHIGPKRLEELQQLLDVVRQRILGDSPARPRGPVHPIEPLADPAARDWVPLPDLDDIDAFLRLEIVDTFGTSIDTLLSNDALIDRIVASVDSLPRSRVAERVRPLGRLSDNLLVDAGDNDRLVLSPDNYARYAFLVDTLVNADPAVIVDLYRRYYPRLQAAYVDLGYPNAYFNDRVVEVIDHLLATELPNAPIALERPHVLYQYADPDLEALSAGQKLLIRMGPENADRTQAALRELRTRLTN